MITVGNWHMSLLARKKFLGKNKFFDHPKLSRCSIMQTQGFVVLRAVLHPHAPAFERQRPSATPSFTGGRTRLDTDALPSVFAKRAHELEDTLNRAELRA